MNVKRNSDFAARLVLVSIFTLVGVLLVISRSMRAHAESQTPNHVWVPLATDWSHRHMVYSRPSSTGQALRLRAEPRYLQQWARRHPALGSDNRRADDATLRADWGMDLLAGGTVGVGQFPAKYSFDVTAAPNCKNDFIVYNTGLGGVSGSTANIVAFNELYSAQGSVGGLCAQNGPSFYWSYYTGAGTVETSVVLSLDGSKVAFVESAAGGATLRLLKWSSSDCGGTCTTRAPDTVATGTSWAAAPCTTGSCVISIAFNGGADDTNSSPFYNYTTDILYVGDNSGKVHKFTGVFYGTPTEVTTTWPITVNAGTTLTSPVYDVTSGNIYIGDSTGRLSFIREVGSTVPATGGCTAPCLSTTNLVVGTGTGGDVVDGPIVDGSTEMVFAVDGSETGNYGTILQASADFTNVTRGNIGGDEAPAGDPDLQLYGGAFDNTYFNSPSNDITGHMYVCGKRTLEHDEPALYQLSFTTAGVLSSVGTPLTPLVSSSHEACSPVSEFYNSGTSTDRIFFSVGDHVTEGAPIPAGSCTVGANAGLGCLIALNVTMWTTTPGTAWPPATAPTGSAAMAVPLNLAGSTSGIVVDNDSTAGQASSIYFSLGTNSTGAGPGLPSCNTTAGVGCAVKLTQSGLN